MSRRRLPIGALLTANAISGAGTAMTLLAVPWFVLQSTGSAASTGVVAAAELVGLTVSSALGGPLVDRLGARRTSVSSDLVAALAVAAVPVLDRLGHLPFWALVPLVAVMGLTRAPGDTARFVLAPDLLTLSGTALERGTSAYDGVSRAAGMLGAPLAGLLIAVSGPPQVLLVDAVTFAVSALLVRLFVPAAGPAPLDRARPLRGYLGQLREGLAHLRRDRLLTAIVLMVAATNCLDSGFSGVVLPVYARQVLHSATAFGGLVAVSGLGALAGTVLYGWLGPRLPRWITYTACFFAIGAPRFALFLFGLGLPALLAGSAVLAIAAGALNPILISSMYQRVPEELRARVFSVLEAGVLAMTPVGTLLAGVVTQGLGVTTTIALIGGTYLLATLCPLVFPVWRGIDRSAARTGAVAGPVG